MASIRFSACTGNGWSDFWIRAAQLAHKRHHLGPGFGVALPPAAFAGLGALPVSRLSKLLHDPSRIMMRQIAGSFAEYEKRLVRVGEIIAGGRDDAYAAPDQHHYAQLLRNKIAGKARCILDLAKDGSPY
jgi:hypothetical protein